MGFIIGIMQEKRLKQMMFIGQKQVINMKKIFAFFVFLMLFGSVYAESPIFAGWRFLSDQQGKNSKNYVFVFSEKPISEKTSFSVFNPKTKKMLCCLIAGGEALTERILENGYKIPSVWISDLTSEIYKEPHVSNRSVYLAKMDNELTTKVFDKIFIDDHQYGGLVISSSPRIIQGGLVEIGNIKYSIKHKSGELADDDGGFDEFDIQTLQNQEVKRKQQVRVNYTTN
jgi:hypothetical protein